MVKSRTTFRRMYRLTCDAGNCHCVNLTEVKFQTADMEVRNGHRKEVMGDGKSVSVGVGVGR